MTQNRTTSTPTRPLAQSFNQLSLDSSPQQNTGYSGNEFIPLNPLRSYYQNNYQSVSPTLASMLPLQPPLPMMQMVTAMPMVAPMSTMPLMSMSSMPLMSSMSSMPLMSSMSSMPLMSAMPSIPSMSSMPSMASMSPMASMSSMPLMSSMLSMPTTTTQVHQENVGGTTYFYTENTTSLNASAAMGPEVCMPPSAMGPPVASPYGTQMYAGTPPQLGPMNMKPMLDWSTMPPPNVVPIPLNYGQPPPCPCNEACYPNYMSPRLGPAPSIEQYSPRSDMCPLDANPTPDFTESLATTFYQVDTIRQELSARSGIAHLRAEAHLYPELPENVEMYTNLIPLEDVTIHSLASSFRVTHRGSGEHFAMRRLHSYPTIPTKLLEMWKTTDHTNVVKLHEYFTTQAFGDHSMVLVYTYHASSETLMNKLLAGGAANTAAENSAYMDPFSSDPDAPRPYTHQKNAMLRAVACGALLPEAVLWSLVIQLTSGLRAVHGAGLACRCLDATKVILTGPRLRITWGGAADTANATASDLHQAQQDDMTAMGRLTLALACRTIHCDNLTASMDLVSRTYSGDFKNVVVYLLSNNNQKTLIDLMPMIGARYFTQIEALQRRIDVMEDELAQEMDNGRLLRILIKLGVITERPELNLDGAWSETGNRYLLKLFRDRVFHAVTEDGRAWLDLAHVIHMLNHLDGGTEDPVEVTSRDDESLLVVTYAELKHCLETSFEEAITLPRT